MSIIQIQSFYLHLCFFDNSTFFTTKNKINSNFELKNIVFVYRVALNDQKKSRFYIKEEKLCGLELVLIRARFCYQGNKLF